ASLQLDITSLDGTQLGPNTVTLTVTDTNGNQSTATATVTVVDEIAPEISGTSDISLNTDPDICGAVVTYPYPVITDNASQVSNYSALGHFNGSSYQLSQVGQLPESAFSAATILGGYVV